MGALEQVLDDSLQVEWSKCYARMQRWEEEVVIIEEEMCRVIAYHEWKAQWWRSQVARRSDTDKSRLHGVDAYAEKQAHLSERLAWKYAEHWLPALKKRGLTPEWEERYRVATPVQHVVSVVADDHDEDPEDDGSEVIDVEEGEPQEDDNDIDWFELDN